MNILLHPTIDPHEAKRIATDNGCLLLFSNGKLKLKQRRHRRGIDAFDMKVIRTSMRLANRSFALLERGEYEESQREIRAANELMHTVVEDIPA
jgi:hypothetical protein